MDYIITEMQTSDKMPYHLLYLADENQQLIDIYLPLSQVYLLKVYDQIQGVCLLQKRDQIGEIMNIAIDPFWQGKGLGKALLNYIVGIAQRQCLHQLVIKTGNSGISQLALYQQQGFDLVNVNYNHFLENYSKPIWESKIQCKHQLVFELTLQS